jgi:hypothetical protein
VVIWVKKMLLFERITASISGFVDSLVAEDGHDLEFEQNRNQAQSLDKKASFVSCSAQMDLESMERGYRRIRTYLNLKGTQLSTSNPRVQREITISRN